MARPRVDKTLGELARRRVDLSSANFGLSFMPVPAEDAVPEGPGSAAPIAPRFAVSAPKRHLKRAVDRNTLKRIAREAWRLADWPVGGRPRVAMLKLRRTDPAWKTMGKTAVKKGWRAEIDALLVRLIRRISTSRHVDPSPERAGLGASPSLDRGSDATAIREIGR
jgi:hypothetical protein